MSCADPSTGAQPDAAPPPAHAPHHHQGGSDRTHWQHAGGTNARYHHALHAGGLCAGRTGNDHESLGYRDDRQHARRPRGRYVHAFVLRGAHPFPHRQDSAAGLSDRDDRGLTKVRRLHFETLRPVCPVCRVAATAEFPLQLAQVVEEENDYIVQGVLHCSNEHCLREYPIVDGIPLIVANIRQYVGDNILSIYARRDLSDFTESILSDCCGSGSLFDSTRQYLSSYAWDHYGDLDPEKRIGDPQPGTMTRTLERGRELVGPLLAGPIIDVGCSVGRSSFSLADGGDRLVLGVDLNFAMLRLAGEVLRHGMVRYPLRRAGLVFQRREFPAHFAHSEMVDFWACDAAALPFSSGTFSLAVSMNLLDCVYAPKEFLTSLGHVLRTGGKAILTCPYDWSPAATPVEAWLGGHSQRSPMAGDSEAILRTLLTPGAHPSSLNTLKLLAERTELPWQVRLHDRSTMTYKLHLVVAERCSAAESPSAPATPK